MSEERKTGKEQIEALLAKLPADLESERGKECRDMLRFLLASEMAEDKFYLETFIIRFWIGTL